MPPSPSWSRLLSPTRSLRARLGLFFGGLSLALAILIAIMLGNRARHHAERTAGESLSSASANMSYLLGHWLVERYEDIHVLAQLPPIRDADANGPSVQQRILKDYQQEYPGYAWIGLLTRDDHLLFGTGPDVDRPKLSPTTQPQLGTVRTVPWPKDATRPAPTRPVRVLDLHVPVTNSAGRTWGTLWACLDWRWAEDVRASLESNLPAGQQENIVVVRPDDGTVLLGPSTLPERLPPDLVASLQSGTAGVLTWPNGRSYLTAAAPPARGPSRPSMPDFPYLVIARQPADVAFAGPRALERTMAAGGIAVGVVFAALGWFLASRIVQPLRAIATAAEQMRAGHPTAEIPPAPTKDEVGRLADSLRSLIVDLRATQSQLAAARDDAESANHAKDRFLAVLSHELRTPLTPILIALSQIDMNAVPAPLRRDLDLIRRNADLEARLIDDLLDTTRIASGKLRLDRQPTDVHAVLRYAIDTCLPDARAKGVTLTAHPDAADHHASADPARLEQILWNLLKNAIKFTPSGGTITVRTRNERSAVRVQGSGNKGDAIRFPSSPNPEPLNPEPSLVLEVTDTGIGIPPDALPLIFRPFEQGHAQITRTFGGLGLGLAISKSLTESHGGSLAACSPGPHQGSAFTLTLPTIPTPAPTAIPSPIPQSAIPNPQSLNILLVEDHADTAALLARILRAKGHTVATANSVSSALSTASTNHFDLVISDLGLPDGSGTDVMRSLRQSLPHPPRGIAVSGYGTDADKQHAHDAGFDAHLTKPIKLSDLEPLLHRA